MAVKGLVLGVRNNGVISPREILSNGAKGKNVYKNGGSIPKCTGLKDKRGFLFLLLYVLRAVQSVQYFFGKSFY